MSRSSLARKDIFDELSQVLDIDPRDIHPIYDRVLLRDIPQDDSRIGSLWVPEVARDKARLRYGLVLAIGDGDKYTEHGLNKFTQEVIRRPIPGGKRYPMVVKAGDMVLYDRRREAEFFIGGETLGIIHEEQSVYGIFAKSTEKCPKCKGSGCWHCEKEGSVIVTTFKPLGTRIIVRRDIEAEQKIGSIHVPDAAREKPQIGEVISIGPGYRGTDGKPIGLDVIPGDRILFGKFSGSEIKLDGQDLLIMREEEVLGVVRAKAVPR